MSAATVIAVGLIGGAGAVGRLLLDGGVSARWTGSFPLGTLVVNLLGSFALGVLVGAGTGEDALRLLATGLLGSFTTFSTWMLETQRLAEDGEGRIAAANITVSLVLGVLLAWAGIRLGAAL
jgi:CrcB protein